MVVAREGKPVGVLTRSDVLEFLAHRVTRGSVPRNDPVSTRLGTVRLLRERTRRSRRESRSEASRLPRELRTCAGYKREPFSARCRAARPERTRREDRDEARRPAPSAAPAAPASSRAAARRVAASSKDSRGDVLVRLRPARPRPPPRARGTTPSRATTASGSGSVQSSSTGSTSAVMKERPARQLHHAEPSTPSTANVQPAVVEALEHLGHARARADLAHAVLVRVHEPELALQLEALADQLLVPVLEDVERHELGRQQNDAEREEADLRPSPQGTQRRLAWSRGCRAARIPAARRVSRRGRARRRGPDRRRRPLPGDRRRARASTGSRCSTSTASSTRRSPSRCATAPSTSFGSRREGQRHERAVATGSRA